MSVRKLLFVMSLEIFSISINLSIFISLLYQFIANKNKFSEKLKNFLFFLLYSISFYLGFYLHRKYQLESFLLREYFFHYINFLGILVVFLFSLALPKKVQSNLGKLSFALCATICFFIFFGSEEFVFFDKKFTSLKLLKAQNPIIGLTFLILYFIKNLQFSFTLFIILFSALFYFYSPKKNLQIVENSIYEAYIPNEFFFQDEGYLVEENSGVYILYKNGKDDIYYKFNLLLLKGQDPKIKKMAQYIISNFEFPILLKFDSEFVLIDLSKSLYRENTKFIINNSTGSWRWEGPIF